MNNKFLHNHTAEAGDSWHYNFAGVLWAGFQHGSWDTLSLNIDDIHLSVQFDGEKSVFVWDYCKELSNNVRFRFKGSADTVEMACAEALAYKPEIVTFKYLGCSHIWYGSKLNDPNAMTYITSIDGDKAEVTGPFNHREEQPYYYCNREYPQASEVLKITGSMRGLECKAATLQAAFIAAVDAPELLKRACGTLIASISKSDDSVISVSSDLSEATELITPPAKIE